MPTPVIRKGGFNLEEFIGPEHAMTRTGPHRARVDLDGTPLEMELHHSGWLTAWVALPIKLEPTDKWQHLALSLLRANSWLNSMAKFAALRGSTPETDGFVLMADVWVRGKGSPVVPAGFFQDLKFWFADGVRNFTKLCGSGEETIQIEFQPSPRGADEQDARRLDGIAEEIECYLKDTKRDWSHKQGSCTFVVNNDYEEYFQKIFVEPLGGEAIRFRTPLTELGDLPESCLIVVSDFLMKANGAMRLARASVVTDTPSPDGTNESACGKPASIVFEVVIPCRCWTTPSIERILSSLTVGARITKQETQVLFDPGAAELYLDIIKKGEARRWQPRMSSLVGW